MEAKERQLRKREKGDHWVCSNGLLCGDVQVERVGRLEELDSVWEDWL